VSLTNLAYAIRNQGRAAVRGVGAGRDMLSAYVFGFHDVTGVELNPIFIDLLTRQHHDYNGVTTSSAWGSSVCWLAAGASTRKTDPVMKDYRHYWRDDVPMGARVSPCDRHRSDRLACQE
jgi:hypothetical protein